MVDRTNRHFCCNALGPVMALGCRTGMSAFTESFGGLADLSRHASRTHKCPEVQAVPCLSAPIASDIEGATDLDWVGLGLETEISRCALDLRMAQERSNRLQIAGAFQDVESFRPA